MARRRGIALAQADGSVVGQTQGPRRDIDVAGMRNHVLVSDHKACRVLGGGSGFPAVTLRSRFFAVTNGDIFA